MKKAFLLSALVGCSAVLLGAFGAHALEERLSQRALEVWTTANRYHFFHLLAILTLEVGRSLGLRCTKQPITLWTIGLVLFSGSLYAYALTGLKFLALIAPLGGVTLALGWLSLLSVEGRS
jgi:uncharacterized membrane protein YgdD (TMEM256/DUF423 family)